MLDFLDKTVERRKVQEGAGGVNIRLKEHQSKRSVKHSKGKAPLRSGDLVLIKLHRVDFAAPINVVLSIGPKDAGQQYVGPGSKPVNRLRLNHKVSPVFIVPRNVVNHRPRHKAVTIYLS
jgi:hypothetical protein